MHLPGSNWPTNTTQYSQATHFLHNKRERDLVEKMSCKSSMENLRLELPVSTIVYPLHLERVGGTLTRCSGLPASLLHLIFRIIWTKGGETGSLGHTPDLPTWSLSISMAPCLRHYRHLHGSKYPINNHLTHILHRGHFVKTERELFGLIDINEHRKWHNENIKEYLSNEETKSQKKF